MGGRVTHCRRCPRDSGSPGTGSDPAAPSPSCRRTKRTQAPAKYNTINYNTIFILYKNCYLSEIIILVIISTSGCACASGGKLSRV